MRLAPARRNQGISMILILRASFVAAAATLVCLALAACSEGPAAPSATTPQEVGVLSLEPAKLAVIRELPGRIAPTRIAEVRARVSGIIDPSQFRAGERRQERRGPLRDRRQAFPDRARRCRSRLEQGQRSAGPGKSERKAQGGAGAKRCDLSGAAGDGGCGLSPSRSGRRRARGGRRARPAQSRYTRGFARRSAAELAALS